MKNKEIKNLLKQKADNVKLNNNLPSRIVEKVQNGADFQVDLAQENGAITKEYKQPQKPKKLVYRAIIPTFAGVLSLAIVFITVVLPLLKNPSKPPITVKAEEVFSKEIFALGNVLSHQEEEIVLTSLTENEFKQICNECVNYLLTGDAFLKKENMSSLVYENTGDNYKEYAYVAKVQFIDVGSFTTEYTAYYNERINGNETQISGIMIIDQKVYRLEGEREQDDDEIESELRIYLNGEKSYISVSNETEINENEFTYEWVQNGNVIKGVSLEIEYENNLKQTEIEITQGQQTQSYEFTYYEQTIVCEYESDSCEQEFTIYIHDEYYLFVSEDYEIRVDK